MADTKKPSDKDYIKLGKQFQGLLDENYDVMNPNWPQRIKLSVVRGLIGGVASVIGATVGIALLIFVLYQLRGIPVIGESFKSIADLLKR